MDYPTELEVSKKLRPFKYGLWVGAVLLPIVCFYFESMGWSGAVAKSGGVVVVAVVYVYFFLENREFLTGHPGNYIDSDNHYVPKKIIGTTYFLTSLIGSLVSIFGDWIFSFLTCGAIQC